MKEEQFKKEFKRIQDFLWLQDWDISYNFLDNPGFTGEISSVDYLRFLAIISFDKKLLDDTEEKVKMVIMHEFCHIFTIMNLKQFEEDSYLKTYIGAILHNEVLMRMNILNEQMTVRLERILSELYKNR